MTIFEKKNRSEDNVLTTSMNEEKFGEIIDVLRENERSAASEQTLSAAQEIQALPAADSSVLWADESQRLFDMGYDPADVDSSMFLANGNFEIALDYLLRTQDEEKNANRVVEDPSLNPSDVLKKPSDVLENLSNVSDDTSEDFDWASD